MRLTEKGCAAALLSGSKAANNPGFARKMNPQLQQASLQFVHQHDLLAVHKFHDQSENLPKMGKIITFWNSMDLFTLICRA